MDNFEKMRSGKLYDPAAADVLAEQTKCMELLYDFNHTRPSEADKRQVLLKQLLGAVGKNCYVEPPLHANWGRNTFFGDNVYANFNLTLVDDAPVYVGDGVMFGPNAVVATAGHPILPRLREKGVQFNLSIRIGRGVWLGAGAIVLPGVSIGENSVIGAGSVVTHDIPANVIAVGNPARVLREIGERDRQYYWRDLEIPPELQ